MEYLMLFLAVATLFVAVVQTAIMLWPLIRRGGKKG
jgi:hypothetical protein